MKKRTSTDIELSFSPWTDESLFTITKIHISEELGGKIAYGSIELLSTGGKKYDDCLKLITDQNTGTLVISDKKEGGVTYEIPIFITSRVHVKYSLKLDVVCLKDINFLTKRTSIDYTDIKDAINQQKTFIGNINLEVDPDSGVDGLKEYQHNESGYSLCTRLCSAYKRDSVYAFGWEGLFIKDIKEERDCVMLKNKQAVITSTGQKFKYNADLNFLPFNPYESDIEDQTSTLKDYSEYAPTNISSVVFRESYNLIHSKYSDHLSNMIYNNRLYNTNLYTSFRIKTRDIPSDYKLGDIVEFEESSSDIEKISNPYTKYLVKSNEFFYSSSDSKATDSDGWKLSWSTVIIGLIDGDWAKNTEN